MRRLRYIVLSFLVVFLSQVSSVNAANEWSFDAYRPAIQLTVTCNSSPSGITTVANDGVCDGTSATVTITCNDTGGAYPSGCYSATGTRSPSYSGSGITRSFCTFSEAQAGNCPITDSAPGTENGGNADASGWINWTATVKDAALNESPTVTMRFQMLSQCPVPTLSSPRTSTCTNTDPSSNLNATANANTKRLQFAVDNTAAPFDSSWICNSGWFNNSGGAFPFGTYTFGSSTCSSSYYNSSSGFVTGDYHWSARTDGGTTAPYGCYPQSGWAAERTFSIDKACPAPPVVPTGNYIPGTQSVRFRWDPLSDIGCANCDGKAASYWLQGWWDDNVPGTPDVWFVNDGTVAAAPSCNSQQTYGDLSCSGKDGWTATFLVRRANDTLNFSCTQVTTAGTYQCPTPTPYPTVAITGVLKEYLGGACSNSISTDNVAISISTSQGSRTCTVTTSPVGSRTRTSYQCLFSFDNQTPGVPTPAPSQALTLVSTADAYSPSAGYWTAANACTTTAANTIGVDLSTSSTVLNKDVSFRSENAWIKVKDTSFQGVSGLTNRIPLGLVAYDSDDTTDRYFDVNSSSQDPGIVSANGTINLGSGAVKVSGKDWKKENYSRLAGMTPISFREYVESRKEYKTVSALDASITEDGIYMVDGNLTLTGSEAALAAHHMVVMVIGDLTINTVDFAPAKSVAFIVTGTINFTGVTHAKGIFVGTQITTGSGGGLKIDGNLISANVLTNNRTQTPNNKPSLFVVFKPAMYMDLLQYLSISKYDWKQLK